MRAMAHVMLVLISLSARIGAISAATTPAQNPDFLSAQALEAAGRTGEALVAYERLYRDDGNDLYFWKLISLYEQTGDWDGLEALAREGLDDDPGDIELSRYLAEALSGRGDHDAARQVLMALLDGRWDQRALVQFVAAEFQSQGDFEGAVNIFLDARGRLGDPTAFAPELGLLYQYEGNTLAAIGEYASVLDTYAAAYAHSVELVNMAGDAGANLHELAAPFLDYLADHPESISAGRIASAILAEAGEYDSAWVAMRTPTVATGSYVELWRFIEQIAGDASPDLLVRAYDDFAVSFPDNASVIPARMRAAEILAGKGDNDQAERRFRAIIGDYAGTYEAADATLSLLELSRASTDPDTYAALLTEFAGTTDYREAACEAWLMLGDARLAGEDVEGARTAYAKASLNAEARHDRYASSIRLATLAFYSGAFDEFGTGIQQAIAVMPEGPEINDLLAERILYMRCDTAEDRERFATYAAGRYAVYRGETGGAEQFFADVAADTASVIAPSAAVALADLYRDGGRTDEAVEWYLRAAHMADDETILAGALLDAAKLAEALPDGTQRARELYVRALTDHSGTVHDMELRTRLQAVLEP